MKIIVLVSLMLLAACSVLPPEGSLERMKYDGRRDLARDCLRDPPQFGFPYTRAENADLLTVAAQHALNVDSYCRKVAQHLVR